MAKGDFNPANIAKARRVCQLGGTESDVALVLGVSTTTLRKWKFQYPAFAEVFQMSKEVADSRVEAALYHRAVGYTFDSFKLFFDAKRGIIYREDFTEHVPPDVTACQFWLRNRKPEEWHVKSQPEKPDDDDDEDSDAVAKFELLITRAAGSKARSKPTEQP